MKASIYNFFKIGDNGDGIAFNALSGALAKISKEYYHEYCLVENGNQHLSELHPENRQKIYQDLIRGGFLRADDSVEESSIIEHSFLKSKYDHGQLNLTIAPTMDCNFNCYYCYEKTPWLKKGYMSDDIIEHISTFVNRAMLNKKKLKVTWYGGEPLLAVNTISKLSENFFNTVERNGCTYSSQIVSNGYFLDKEKLRLILKCKISSAQITLEGTEYIHNKRRYDRLTHSSFQTIIENVKAASEHIKIALRVNLDKENIAYLEDLINYLEVAGVINENVSISLGRVKDCSQIMTKESMELLIDAQDYVKKEKQIITKAIMDKNLAWIGSYPAPTPVPCGAINISTFSIDPEGYVYKCWEELGITDKSIYHVSNPGRISNNELKWLDCDPKKDSECLNCKHLPLCQGGCALQFLRGKKTCSYWKENLNDMLSVLAYKYKHLVKPN